MALDHATSRPPASPAREVAGVRALTPADAAFAAALHARALPHGFFARLGPRYLRAYHASFAASPFAVALVAVVGARPVGVLLGTLDNRAHYRWVVRHRLLRLAFAGVLALAVRPRLAAAFLRTRAAHYARSLTRLRRRGVPAAGGPQAPGRPVAVLTHVAVASAARGRGVGARLTEAFVGTAHSAAGRIALVTLAGDAGAGRFYERLGWVRVDERRDRDGRLIAEYEYRRHAALPLARR